MPGIGLGIRGAMIAAIMTVAGAGPLAAQSAAGRGGNTLSGVYAMIPEGEDLTAEEIAANADKTIIIHFMADVSYWSGLQLVIMVQDYYRDGYRKFVMPIQTAGGTVASAMYAYETLSRMPIEFSTVAMGDVDSSGIMLYCLGQKRYASPAATFLFHPMSGTVNSNRRGQEAAERQIENLNVWTDTVNKDCFGEIPESWDLERQDYRVLAKEASEVGLVNAGEDYFAEIGPIGGVSYVYPIFFPPQRTAR